MIDRNLIARVRAVTIVCTEPKRTAHFYESVLGAIRVPTDIHTCARFRLGTLELSILPNAERRSPASFPMHAMPILWLEVDDLAEANRQFAQHGVEVVDPGDGQFMMIADPDGLVIEVWQARWAVYRQDDNGNRFTVESGLSRNDAEQLVKLYENRGHKQLYWAENE